MDNQHKHIKTYRDLTQAEIDLMNEVKDLEAKFAEVCKKINAIPETNKSDLEHGINSIITGCMWTIRAVARPTSPFNEIEIKK